MSSARRCPTRRCRFASCSRSCFSPAAARGLMSMNRHMVETVAVLFDGGIVVGAVHQVIQVGDFRGGHGGERNGDLAVMDGGCGEHATDRDLAVRGVDMQLVADPGFLMALGVALGADIA